MASAPSLDFDALLAPIPGENPAGVALRYLPPPNNDSPHVGVILEEARKEEDPNDFAPDDPMRPTKPKRANWQGIIELTKKSLTEQSKDLHLAARLTEALARHHGFGGLRDGLQLMRLMVEQCWERMYPAVEDGDMDMRATPFFWLDDAERGARFPNVLRMLPIVKAENGQFSCLDWRRSQDGQGTVSRDDMEKAIAGANPEAASAVAEDLACSMKELNALGASLNEKMGQAAPGLNGLRQALENCQLLADHVAQRHAPQTGGAAAGTPDGQGRTSPSGIQATRTEVYRQLAQAAAQLRQLEPHSPIPYLIQKAVELGALPFPLLIRELVRDAGVLSQLNRELGIKEEAPKEGAGGG